MRRIWRWVVSRRSSPVRAPRAGRVLFHGIDAAAMVDARSTVAGDKPEARATSLSVGFRPSPAPLADPRPFAPPAWPRRDQSESRLGNPSNIRWYHPRWAIITPRGRARPRGDFDMSMTVTTAPCCWGVDDIANPHLPDWRLVLDEVAAAGWQAGLSWAYGYMPLDAPAVGAELQARRALYRRRHHLRRSRGSTAIGPPVRQTREICLPLTTHCPSRRWPRPTGSMRYLTVMDWGHDERDFAAGHADRARGWTMRHGPAWSPISAPSPGFARGRIRRARRDPPMPAAHIRFADEIARIAADNPRPRPDSAIDTGHCHYSGMDPLAVLRPGGTASNIIHSRISTRRNMPMSRPAASAFRGLRRGVMCPHRARRHRLSGDPRLSHRTGLWRLYHRRAGTRPAQFRRLAGRCQSPRATI